MHVRVADVLPWRRLGGIAARAGLAAVPAAWLLHTMRLPPLADLVVGGATYTATYAVLSYGPSLVARAAVTLELAVGRWLAGWLADAD